MRVANFAAAMVTSVRSRGGVPAYLAMSPDLYSRRQAENSGVEPIDILGLPIRIRDNYKPKTMLILGERSSQSDCPRE